MPGLKNRHVPPVLATEYASYRDQVIEVFSRKLRHAERTWRGSLVVYDPMAGTAPLLPLAELRGYIACFNDLNSLHRYVNAAKTFPAYAAFRTIGPSRLLSLVCSLTRGLDRCQRTTTQQWIEDSVLRTLTRAWNNSNQESEQIAHLIRAVLLVAVRRFASYIRTKNPTWLKPGGVRPDVSAEEAFGHAINRLDAFYQGVYDNQPRVKVGRICLTSHDASRWVPGRKANVIMTSPPFCNRVDWDRLYGPEHLFLTAVGVWHTRTDFVGTTAVRKYQCFDADFACVTERSRYLAWFLEHVRDRQSTNEKRSDYYVKYFTRYFAGLFRVFDASTRAMSRDNLGIYFAVQDNSHRGLLVDIGKALAEFLGGLNFRARRSPHRWDMPHMGLQNISRRHKLVTPRQRESIWHAVRQS